MRHTCDHGILGGQKRVSDPLDLELQTVVRRHVGDEHHTWPLPSPTPVFFFFFESHYDVALAGLELAM